MEKFKFVVLVIIFVAAANVLLTAVMPILVAAKDIAIAGADYSQFQETEAALESSPLWLYFIPNCLGIAAIVWKLKFSRD